MIVVRVLGGFFLSMCSLAVVLWAANVLPDTLTSTVLVSVGGALVVGVLVYCVNRRWKRDGKPPRRWYDYL